MSTLTKIAAFKDLPQQALDRLERGSIMLDPPSGTQILTSGEEANSVYAIIGGTGFVRVGAADRQSKAMMLVMLREGEIFGEIAVLDGGGRTAEAVTEGRVRLLRISGSTFMAVLQDTPSLGVNLCRILAARLRRTDALLQDATFGTVEARLARQILYLAELPGHPSDDGWRVGGRFRQADLADLLGTTARSIITVLNRWRAEGVVKYDASRGQLTICDEQRLRAAIGPY